MGWRQGDNILGIQRGERGHYISNKRRDAIKRATAARLRKGLASQPLIPPTPPSMVNPFNAFRIMNLDELATRVQQITEQSATCGNSCTIEGETYRAGQSTFSKCDATFSIPSLSRFVDGDIRKLWTVNVGAVLGQMATGGGASCLQQVMASVGVLSMSNQHLPQWRGIITEGLQVHLSKSMIATSKEEHRLAVENDDYFQGVPAITVIADGGWSKRSHKHSYNAKSGVAVIIGSRTKKLLFLGVRNKYCSTCSIAENAGQEAPAHASYRNWNCSSPTMESDILVEGLRQPMEYATCS